MPDEFLSKLFSLDGQVALVTGGTGVLGGVMARGLAQAGAKVAVMGRRKSQADEVAGQIDKMGCEALALPADVLDHDQLAAAQRAMTWVVAYSAAKAAVDNFTRWLAVEMARKYGEGLRVNAIAPGFFI